MSESVVEWAPFTLAPGVTESTLLEASAQLQADFLDQCPGFVGRELLRQADGSWCDLVRWRDRTAVDAAMARVSESHACHRYFSLMQGADHAAPGAGVILAGVRATYPAPALR